MYKPEPPKHVLVGVFSKTYPSMSILTDGALPSIILVSDIPMMWKGWFKRVRRLITVTVTVTVYTVIQFIQLWSL